MKRVAMFVTNPCTHDARVMKEAATLSENGYIVRVFALANAFNDPGIYEQGGYTVHRLKFNNIFVRARERLWLLVSTLLAPFSHLRAFLAWLIKVSTAIPLLLFAAIFPTVAKKISTSVGNTKRSRAEFLEFRYRQFVVSFYLFLRARMPFRYRRSVIMNFNRLCLYIFAFFRKCMQVKSKLRRLYVVIRSRMMIKVNKLIYSLLLPLHKISTYYYFCKASSKEAGIWGLDVAHAHDLNTMYAAYLLKKRYSVVVIYDSHELWIHRNRVGRKATLEKILDKIIEKALIKHADGVITVCDSIGEWLSNRYNNIPRPVILRNMPYEIEPEPKLKHDLKARLGLDSQSNVMIYTGKITSGRGIEIGLRALVSLPNLNFVLLGYGEEGYVEKIKKLSMEFGLKGRVFFCDPVPYQDVTSFISGADFALVYIEPICLSYEYALPNKLFESIQAGIPILGSNLVEIQEIVEGENVGLCFSSELDLIEKLGHSFNEGKLQEWKKSIDKCKSKMCWELEQTKLIDIYQELT